MSLIKLKNHVFKLWNNKSLFFKITRAFSISKNLASDFSAKVMENISQPKFLDVHIPSENQPLKLDPMWLRDHCRCSECYNAITHQRNYDIVKLNKSLTITNHSQNEDVLNVHWSDGHNSTFSVPWIVNNTYDGKYKNLQKGVNRKVTTWDSSTVNSLGLEPIFHNSLMNDENTLREIYRRVIQYGFAKIEQVPPTQTDTVMVFERVCRMSHTFFGSYWETGTNFDHKDTGYLNGYLEAHTDNTYFTEALGYLVFHCTCFEGKGGESFFVDGFHVAKQLMAFDPEAYDYLSKVHLEAEYIEPGEHFFHIGPILRHHPINRQLEQIRFNMLDRAPLSSIPQSEVGTYYRHMKTMAEFVRRKENEHRFRLTPGTVLIIDNWRLLHGRAGYNGKRVLQGCYYNRSDFMSKARHHGIIL